MDDVNDALQRVGLTKSTILWEDFNAHIGTDSEIWKGVIGTHGDPAFNENGRHLFQLCRSVGCCPTGLSTIDPQRPSGQSTEPNQMKSETNQNETIHPLFASY